MALKGMNLLAGFAVLGLAGCQNLPPPELSDIGAPMSAGGPKTYAFIRTASEEAIAPAAVEAAVRADLGPWGLTEAAPDSAYYLVQVSLTSMPVGVGVAIAGPADKPSTWLAPPPPKPHWPNHPAARETVSVAFLNAADGVVVYRRIASGVATKAPPAQRANTLINLALSAPGKAAPAPKVKR